MGTTSKTNPRLHRVVRELRDLSRENGVAIWRDVADRLERSRKNWSEVNLSRLGPYAAKGEQGDGPRRRAPLERRREAAPQRGGDRRRERGEGDRHGTPEDGPRRVHEAEEPGEHDEPDARDRPLLPEAARHDPPADDRPDAPQPAAAGP